MERIVAWKVGGVQFHAIYEQKHKMIQRRDLVELGGCTYKDEYDQALPTVTLHLSQGATSSTPLNPTRLRRCYHMLQANSLRAAIGEDYSGHHLHASPFVILATIV